MIVPVFCAVRQLIVRDLCLNSHRVVALLDVVEGCERIIENPHAGIELFNNAGLFFLVNLVCLANLFAIAFHAFFFCVEDIDGNAGTAAKAGIVNRRDNGRKNLLPLHRLEIYRGIVDVLLAGFGISNNDFHRLYVTNRLQDCIVIDAIVANPDMLAENIVEVFGVIIGAEVICLTRFAFGIDKQLDAVTDKVFIQFHKKTLLIYNSGR